MNQRRRPITILLAEDDPDDRLLAQDALEESSLLGELRCVENGEELMDYLYRRGQYTQENSPRPAIILLDLNLPKKDGREALNEIKADPELRRIPVVVFTTSKTHEDIKTAYDGGANSFITKPLTFDSLVDVMETLSKYWFGLVELPPNGVADGYGQQPH
ncbi:MAG: response regulator [Microcoleus vaginatus WJT46-NPBG5]|nr:response regulator [Microcoleus vaginatus WJT46-NPBG5]